MLVLWSGAVALPCVHAMENADPTSPMPHYEPPLLREIGGFATLTQANGIHLGKVEGGPDAFGMTGHGAIVHTSA